MSVVAIRIPGSCIRPVTLKFSNLLPLNWAECRLRPRAIRVCVNHMKQNRKDLTET